MCDVNETVREMTVDYDKKYSWAKRILIMTQHNYSGTGRLVSHYPDLDEIHMEMTNYNSTTPPCDRPLTLYRVHILCCILDSDGICTDVFAYNLNHSPQLDGTQLHPPGKLTSTDDWVSFTDRHWKDATFYRGADFSNSAANATLSAWRYSPSKDLTYTYCCNNNLSAGSLMEEAVDLVLVDDEHVLVVGVDEKNMIALICNTPKDAIPSLPTAQWFQPQTSNDLLDLTQGWQIKASDSDYWNSYGSDIVKLGVQKGNGVGAIESLLVWYQLDIGKF